VPKVHKVEEGSEKKPFQKQLALQFFLGTLKAAIPVSSLAATKELMS